MHQVSRLVMAATVLLGAPALAKPGDTAAPSPCVNRSETDHPGRDVRDVTATATSLVFCTGNDCWSLDVATNKYKSIATITPTARPPSGAPQFKSADGRATATATEVAFCPTGPASCKKFTYKFPFEPQNGLHPIINAQGTLGAVIYKGLELDGEPSYVLTYDLTTGKLIKQVKASHATVFRNAFLIDHVFYSAKLKKLGKLAAAESTAEIEPVAGTDLVALSDQERGDVIVQDSTTGKARARVKLGGDVGIARILSSPDGSRLHVIGAGAHEGEVFTIDVAKNKVVAHGVPATCAAGTARAR